MIWLENIYNIFFFCKIFISFKNIIYTYLKIGFLAKILIYFDGDSYLIVRIICSSVKFSVIHYYYLEILIKIRKPKK